MTGSFLDTTIVIHIADGPIIDKKKGEAFVTANQPAEMPYYALRELLAGRVRILCEAHNSVHAAENHGEALLALLNRNPAEGRKKEARIKDVADALKRVFNANPEGDRKSLKRELLQDLSMKAVILWRKARNLSSIAKTQSLGCLNDGNINYGDAGELRGPTDSFNCIKTERCAAAAYLYDNKSVLTKMIETLHPNNLTPKIANKQETRQRRKALKELLSVGPAKFNKGQCRALGDAYFAAMCPAGSVVLTSNLEDHLPLCLALGKEATEP